MRHLNKRFIVISSVISLAAVALIAQQQQTAPAQPDQGPAVFRADTFRVVCHTTVVDKAGHLVTDLPQTAFTVFENGVQQKITLFKREDVPVSIGLIIDNSGSMRDKREKVKLAAVDLAKASNKEDEDFVVNFNDTAYLDLPHDKDFTNDIGELEEALTRIDSRGGTAMRDAIRMSIDHLKEKARKEKKVLVVVTDGVDNSSLVSLESLVKSAQQADVVIYAIGLLSDEDRRDATRAKRELNAIAEATGGESFYPKEVSEVDHITQQVAHDIRNQYTIAYAPSNGAMDGSYRQIKISVKAPGNPTPRTRSGYYATPDQAQPPKGALSIR